MEMSYPLNLDEYIGAEVVQLWHYGRTTGVFSAENNLRVVPAGGMKIKIMPGAAWLRFSEFGSCVYGNTGEPEDLVFELDLGEAVLNRVDRIGVRYTVMSNKVEAYAGKGAPASSPQPNNVQRDAEIHELALADIVIDAGTSEITEAMIRDQRLNEEVCGIVRDGVNGIPTQMLYMQWNVWFTSLKAGAELDAFELTQWILIFKDTKEDQYNEWFVPFVEKALADIAGLEEQIHDILDQGAAGALLNILNEHMLKNAGTPDGVHGLRVSDDLFLQNYRDGRWSGVRAGNAPPNVSGLHTSVGPDSISIAWKDPADIVVEGIALAKWDRTVLVYRTDRYPEHESDGTVLVTNTVRDQYDGTPYVHEPLILGQTYYYQLFPISDSDIVNRDEANRVSGSTASLPPGNVTGFAGKAGNAKITLTWGDPPDTITPELITWAGTKIVRKEGGYPAHEGDGVLAVDSKVRDQYKTDGFVDTGLENKTTYYYQAFPYATTGSVNRNETNRTSARPFANDGVNWATRQSAADIGWRSICYGNGVYVAIANSGSGNRIMTSPDGITWTLQTTPASNSWSSVCYGNGTFVAVSLNGTNRVMTSSDGLNWTLRSSPNLDWYSVCYGNGLFVAVSFSGSGTRVMTSPDGVNWTARTAPSSNSWSSVCYGNGLFVAVASSGTNRVMTSPDGIVWTLRTTPAANSWGSVCYGNGLFVVVSYDGTERIMTSPDGVTWTTHAAPIQNSWYSVCFGDGLFVAVSITGTGDRIMTSEDGINWVIRQSPADNNWVAVCAGAGMFVAVASSGTGNRVMTSGEHDPSAQLLGMMDTLSLNVATVQSDVAEVREDITALDGDVVTTMMGVVEVHGETFRLDGDVVTLMLAAAEMYGDVLAMRAEIDALTNKIHELEGDKNG